MIYVVLVVGLLNLALTAKIYRTAINSVGQEIEIRWVEEEDAFTPLLTATEEPTPEPEQQPVVQVATSGSDSGSGGAWRNQTNIQPWAPNSSAGSTPIPQGREPLERPPGFAS